MTGLCWPPLPPPPIELEPALLDAFGPVITSRWNMTPMKKTKLAPENPAERPDLRQKYRQLAIPAVVAAVMADKARHGRPAERSVQAPAKPDRHRRS